MNARVRRNDDTAVAVLAWSEQTSRAEELARAVGGRAQRFSVPRLRGPATAPLRYVINAYQTVRWLALHRPGSVIVQNPPIVLPVLAWVYGAFFGARVVLDSHPASFGR